MASPRSSPAPVTSPLFEAETASNPTSPEIEAKLSRRRLRSTDSADGQAPPKAARITDAPRIGPLSTPVVAQPSKKRPELALDFTDIPSFSLHRAATPEDATSQSPSPTAANLRPMRPRLVSRFSSDDSLDSRPCTPAAVTPGTQDALCAFGIASGSRTPRSPIGISPGELFGPPLMARSRSIGQSRLNVSSVATPPLVDCEGAAALCEALLPRNSVSPRPVPPMMSRQHSNPYFAPRNITV